MLLWAALVAVTIVGVFVPVAVLDKRLKGWVGDTDRRGAELAAVVGYAVLISAIAWVVPPGRGPGAVPGRRSRSVARLPAARQRRRCCPVAIGPGPACLCRAHPPGARDRDDARRAARLRRTPDGVRWATVRPASPGRLDAGHGPLRFVRGVAYAGSSCRAGSAASPARLNDPARRLGPTARIEGYNIADLRHAVRVAAGGGGGSARAPRHEAGLVGIVVVPPEQSEATEFDPRWPLKVSVHDLDAGAVKQRFDRRDEIQVRRQLFRGLAKALQARRRLSRGPPAAASGWRRTGGSSTASAAKMPTPAARSAPPLVGPPYHRAIPAPRPATRHAVLRATQIDMIFVEDGVTLQKLERVLRVLTELYDVHGGAAKAEELHFRGLPKVKVMIHDYEPGNPFRSDPYPEPKFDDLSRVRRAAHLPRSRRPRGVRRSAVRRILDARTGIKRVSKLPGKPHVLRQIVNYTSGNGFLHRIRVPRVPTHFSTIGLFINTDQELLELVERVMPDSERIETALGTYLRWVDPSGAELWSSSTRRMRSSA